jgi:hypothetical protein
MRRKMAEGGFNESPDRLRRWDFFGYCFLIAKEAVLAATQMRKEDRDDERGYHYYIHILCETSKGVNGRQRH